MPYTEKQRRYFGAVASGRVRDPDMSKQQAHKLLREGAKEGWVKKLKRKLKTPLKNYRRSKV